MLKNGKKERADNQIKDEIIDTRGKMT